MAEKIKRNTTAPRQAYGTHAAYNSTSSAYDYIENEEALPKPKVRRVRKVKRGRQEVYINSVDRASRPSASIFIAMTIVAIGIGMGVVSYSLVATQNINNNKLRAELKAMQSRTAELAVEASQSMDLGEIERIARTRLEMSEPQLHQIVHVSIPKENYTVHLPETEDISYAKAETALGGFENIIKFFKKD